MDRQRHLRAVRPDLSEINDSHQINVPARGFKRVLVGHLALDRQKDCVRLKTDGSAKAKIDRLR